MGRNDSSRMPVIDVARGLVIVGVVFNHTVDGMVSARILDIGSPIGQFNNALYVFRMPALAFLLGMFIPGAVGKRGNKGYIRERATFALYLYLIWFFIQSIAEILTSNVRNNNREWDSLLHVWAMPAHLWFLPFLAVGTIVAVVAAAWRSRRRASVALIGVGVISCLAWGWNPDGWFGMRGLSLLFFVVVGSALGLRRVGMALSGTWTRIALVASVSSTLFVAMVLLGVMPGTQNIGVSAWWVRPLSMLAAATGIVALLSVAAFFSRVPVISWVFRILGRYTLQIYVVHVMIAAGTRIALTRLGVDSVPGILITGVILATLVPVAMARAADKFGFAWLFTPPGALGRWSKAANMPAPKRENASVKSENRSP
ncbi:acyltransferase family protein [Arthrobacter sp. HMWF013]|uniref:acyltransferase family protein n=1 Tax=Arthrobacter sp. HMWF013 TaxID=2056849 RepID=UPI000D34AAA4|nr:acyltransferase [Arthrobacter sp. HMWF013]PTT69451.1 hypothetical protein DBR22_03855 [Arthrobacter sp. HMWF013]